MSPSRQRPAPPAPAPPPPPPPAGPPEIDNSNDNVDAIGPNARSRHNISRLPNAIAPPFGSSTVTRTAAAATARTRYERRDYCHYRAFSAAAVDNGGGNGEGDGREGSNGRGGDSCLSSSSSNSSGTKPCRRSRHDNTSDFPRRRHHHHHTAGSSHEMKRRRMGRRRRRRRRPFASTAIAAAIPAALLALLPPLLLLLPSSISVSLLVSASAENQVFVSFDRPDPDDPDPDDGDDDATTNNTSQCVPPPPGQEPTGRRFYASAASDSDCPSGTGWEMIATLDDTPGVDRKVRILSCRDDEVLSIELTEEDGGEGPGPGPLTDGERLFFSELASSISSSGPPNDDFTTLSYQAVNAARLLSQWPVTSPPLPVSYNLDPAAQRTLQQTIGSPDSRFVGDGTVPGNLPQPETTPGHVHLDGRLYTTLCPYLSRYLDSGNLDIGLAARIDAALPCDASSTPGGMDLWKSDGTDRVCVDMPLDGEFPIEYGSGWAVGGCFGRCGMGCMGGGDGDDPIEGDGTAMVQYTYDCARLDFCARFGLALGTSSSSNGTAVPGEGGDEDGGGGCGPLFLDAIDDWVWSGNCDLQAKEEIRERYFGGSCGPPPAVSTGGGGLADVVNIRSAGEDPDLSPGGGGGDAGGGGAGPGEDPELGGGGYYYDADSPRGRLRADLEALKPHLLRLLDKEVRTIDGSGNNLANPDWGAADTPLLRRTAIAGYGDGTAMVDDGLPNPRVISNTLMRAENGGGGGGGGGNGATKTKTVHLSDMVWQWGQFLDHDVVHTAAHPTERADIPVPLGDDMLDPNSDGNRTIPFQRSIHTFDSEGGRQQLNALTSYIDGSVVYGSTPDRAAALRTFSSGLLATSEGDRMPYNRDGLHNAPVDNDPNFFLAGDVRSNEQIGLTAVHTVFLREHNLLARTLNDVFLSDGMELDDEQLYQLARRFVGAEIQSVTYNEFLPVVMGRGVLSPHHPNVVEGYDPAIDPSLLNEFSIAYRVGHIMLSESLQLMGPEYELLDEGPVPLEDAFFNNTAYLLYGEESILRGLAAQRCHNVEPLIVEAVRSMLFGDPGHGGMDLAALNVQRNRDHGLGTYNDVREHYGLGRAQTFGDVSSDPAVVTKLEGLYPRGVDTLDLWVGCVAEDHRDGAMVGETLFAILHEQFTNLRAGDRFWYGWDLGEVSEDLVAFVDSHRLSDIIVRNTAIEGWDLPSLCLTDGWM